MPLGVESKEPDQAIYDLAADPGSVANLYSGFGSSQHRPGVVARCCRLSSLPHPHAAVGTDNAAAAVALVMFFAPVAVVLRHPHPSRLPSA